MFAFKAVITGWCGANISGLPGGGSWVIVAVVMVVISVALVVQFRRSGWL